MHARARGSTQFKTHLPSELNKGRDASHAGIKLSLVNGTLPWKMLGSVLHLGGTKTGKYDIYLCLWAVHAERTSVDTGKRAASSIENKGNETRSSIHKMHEGGCMVIRGFDLNQFRCARSDMKRESAVELSRCRDQ